VKVDADILLSEVENPTGHIVVDDIKRVVDRHGMDLIVEKIEHEKDLLELLDLRVDFGQGYLFGAPKLTRIE
jgi:cyclic-di-GMP phosphodiesterase TipF (flagellum assembly factor)